VSALRRSQLLRSRGVSDRHMRTARWWDDTGENRCTRRET